MLFQKEPFVLLKRVLLALHSSHNNIYKFTCFTFVFRGGIVTLEISSYCCLDLGLLLDTGENNRDDIYLIS